MRDTENLYEAKNENKKMVSKDKMHNTKMAKGVSAVLIQIYARMK